MSCALVCSGRRPARRLLYLSLVLLLLAGQAGYAATRIIDRIDVETTSDSNDIHLYFNIPIRVISQVLSSSQRELNIQVQPTVTPGSGEDILSRDEVLSWRPTAEIPLDRIKFRPRGVATSLIELSFVTPVRAYIVQKQRDFFSLTISLKNMTPVEQVVLDESPADEAADQQATDVPDDAVPVPPTGDSGAERLPAPKVSAKQPRLTEGRLVINLQSQTRPINFATVAPVQVPEGATLYTTQAKVNGTTWYRLRLGFYADREAAGKALKRLRRFYPDAWIDSATAEEKAEAVPAAVEGVAEAPPGPRKPQKRTQELPSSERLTLMMTTARDIMTAGDYPKAIRMLSAVLDQPENRYTQEAQELLGLARERNGQLAHAYAEYEKYIETYPEGEDVERVKQRLAGLTTARRQPQPALRKSRAEREQEREDSPWEVFGSLAVGYRFDGIDSDFSDESVTRSEMGTDLYLSARRPVYEGDLRLQVTGGYQNDFQIGSAANESTLSDAYVEYEHRPSEVTARLGRQRLRSSGVLDRFDGLAVRHRFTPDVEGRVALGFPVQSSSDTSIDTDKRFIGFSVGLDSIVENTDVDLFFIEQEVDGLTDRRAIGGEFRYFEETWSVFGLLDYDIHFDELNTALVQTNWNYSPETALYLILDYRFSPTLTLFNAIQGQPLSTIAALREIFSDDELLELARDRAARSKIVSLGGTQTFSNEVQLSGDFTWSNIGSTTASGGVPATESTGDEYFYTLQLSKPSLFKQDDIGIVSLRYNDGSAADVVTVTAESRYPITELLRIHPRFAVAYRDNNVAEGDRTTYAVQLQADYRFRRDLLLEGEIGATYYDESNANETLKYTDYYLGVGLRWEF